MGGGNRSPQPTRFLIAAAAIGLVLRLAFGLGYWNHQTPTRDELEYFSLARSLAHGQGFVYDDVLRRDGFLPFGRSPGYPTFLAVIGAGREVHSAVPASVKVAQSFVGAFGVFIVGLLGYRLGGPRTAKAAATIAACYPPLVWIAAYALSEAIFWPIGVLIALLFDRIGDRSGDRIGDRIGDRSEQRSDRMTR